MINKYVYLIVLLSLMLFDAFAEDKFAASVLGKKKHFSCQIFESYNGKPEKRSESVVVSMTGAIESYKIKNDEVSLYFKIAPKSDNNKSFEFSVFNNSLKILDKTVISKKIKAVSFDINSANKAGSNLSFEISCNKIRKLEIVFDRESKSMSDADSPQYDVSGYQDSACYKKIKSSQVDAVRSYNTETNNYERVKSNFYSFSASPNQDYLDNVPVYDFSYEKLLIAADKEYQDSEVPAENSVIMQFTNKANKKKHVSLSWQQVRQYIRYGIKNNHFCKDLTIKRFEGRIASYIKDLVLDNIKTFNSIENVNSDGRGNLKETPASDEKIKSSNVQPD